MPCTVPGRKQIQRQLQTVIFPITYALAHMAIAKPSRHHWKDPDSDEENNSQHLPTVARRKAMEHLLTHDAPPPKPAKSAPNRTRVIDLVTPPGTPPLRQNHTGEVSSQISLDTLPARVEGRASHSADVTKRPLLGSSSTANRHAVPDLDQTSFGSSVVGRTNKRDKWASFKSNGSSAFDRYNSPRSQGAPVRSHAPNTNAWPDWVKERRPFLGLPPAPPGPKPIPVAIASTVPKTGDDAEHEEGEVFDLGNAEITAADFERYRGDADEHMRELLSGAIGDGEEGGEGREEGDDVVEGFAKNMRLMPHQVRGVKWMKGRESGRKYGGILADVSQTFVLSSRRAHWRGYGSWENRPNSRSCC